MKHFVCVLAWILVLTGCADIQRATNPDHMTPEEHNAHAQELRAKEAELKSHYCDPLTEDELIEREGAPNKSDNLGSYLVYTYVKDNGVTSSGGGTAFKGFVTTDSSSVQHYNQRRFYFKEGHVVKCDEQNQ